MGNTLQVRRAAADWASAGQIVEITEEIGFFDGLAAVVEEDLAALDPDKMPRDWRSSPVTGVLHFGFVDADERIPVVTGNAKAEVDAVCQRCLEPFRMTLETEPKLLLLQGDDEVAGFDEYEVWELEERLLKPQDIVDELLVMAMPFSAMHDNMAECRAFAADEDDSAEKVTRPFAALREQMAEDNESPDE